MQSQPRVASRTVGRARREWRATSPLHKRFCARDVTVLPQGHRRRGSVPGHLTRVSISDRDWERAGVRAGATPRARRVAGPRGASAPRGYGPIPTLLGLVPAAMAAPTTVLVNVS